MLNRLIATSGNEVNPFEHVRWDDVVQANRGAFADRGLQYTAVRDLMSKRGTLGQQRGLQVLDGSLLVMFVELKYVIEIRFDRHDRGDGQTANHVKLLISDI